MAILPGCGFMATGALSSNIRTSEFNNKNIIYTNDIKDDICKVRLDYICTRSYGDNSRESVYGGKYFDEYLYFVFDMRYEEKMIIIQDSIRREYDLNISLDSRNTMNTDSLQLIIARGPPDPGQSYAFSAVGGVIWLQLGDYVSKDINAHNDNDGDNYLEGIAWMKLNDTVINVKAHQSTGPKTSVKIASYFKRIGYLVTVPFDVVTLPIQLLISYFFAPEVRVGP